MDYETQQEAWLEDADADFDNSLIQRDWANARDIMHNLDDLGYDVSYMRRKYNEAVLVNNVKNSGGITFKSV